MNEKYKNIPFWLFVNQRLEHLATPLVVLPENKNVKQCKMHQLITKNLILEARTQILYLYRGANVLIILHYPHNKLECSSPIYF